MTATKLQAGTTVIKCDLPGHNLPVPVFCWTAEQVREVLASAEVEVVGVVGKDGEIVWRHHSS